MKRNSYKERSILEDQATIITGIKVVNDREYVKLTYERVATKHHPHKAKMIIHGRFKSKRRII